MPTAYAILMNECAGMIGFLDELITQEINTHGHTPLCRDLKYRRTSIQIAIDDARQHAFAPVEGK